MLEEGCWSHRRWCSQWFGREGTGPALVSNHLLDPDRGIMSVSEVEVDIAIVSVKQAVLFAHSAYHLVFNEAVLIRAFSVNMGRSYRMNCGTEHAYHAAAPGLATPCEG